MRDFLDTHGHNNTFLNDVVQFIYSTVVLYYVLIGGLSATTIDIEII